jgi:hypothetical protein
VSRPTLFIPSIHLPDGRDLFRNLPHRPSQFRKVLKSYGERSLLECSENDSIVLSEMPDREFLGFLQGNGIGTDKIIIRAGGGGNLSADILGNPEAMKGIEKGAGGSDTISFYIHLEEEREIAERLGFKSMHPDLTRMFNKYYFLIRLCEDLDIKLNKSAQVRSGRFAEPAMKLLSAWGKLFIRGNGSVGGAQVFTAESEEDIQRIAKAIGKNQTVTRYFAQKFLDVEESWNVQYLFTGNGRRFVGGTRQLLAGGISHKGNVGGSNCEVPKDVRSIAEKIAERLEGMGVAGYAGIDLITTGGSVFPVEINARGNTSTPALTLYNRLREETPGRTLFFTVMEAETPGGIDFTGFAERVGRENLFRRGSSTGIVPYHFGASRVMGKIDTVIFAESQDELDRLTGTLTV